MGSIIFNSKNGWWLASYIDHHGRRRRRKASRDEREAKEILTAIEGQIIRDRLLNIRPIKEVRFRDFAGIFMKHAMVQIKAWARYRSSLVSLVPFFGNAQMTAIDPEMVDRYKGTRVGKVTNATVNRDLQCLRRMFNLGILWGYAREAPTAQIRFLREPQGRLRYLTREEFRRLIEACPDHLRPIVKVSLHTGMRQGELLSLSWSDVDFENGLISINETKTATPRKVPMNETARTALLEMRLRGKGRVFRDAAGQPLPARTLQWQFRRALADAGIEGAVYHTLRHSAASWMAMGGVPLLAVKEVLGHRDVRMTLRYSHLAPDQGFAAVEKLEEFAKAAPERFNPTERVPARKPQPDPLSPAAERATPPESG